MLGTPVFWELVQSEIRASGVDGMFGVEHIQTASGTYTWIAPRQTWLMDKDIILV